MKHIVYKTTNIVNNKIYIGIHSQFSPETFDGYFGSGTIISKAIKKYGKENFTRDLLFVYDSLLDARNKEREIVNDEFVKCTFNYNVSIGGTGGNTIAGYSDDERISYIENLKSSFLIAKVKRIELYGAYFSEKTINKMSDLAKDRIVLSPKSLPKNKDRVHTKEARDNFSIAGKERCGKYIFITDGNVTEIHENSSPIPIGWVNGFGLDRPRLKNHKEETKQKIGNSKNIKGIKKYTDGKINVNIKPDDDIPSGFYPGITSNKPYKLWITDNVISVKILPTETLPDGFRYGRVFKRKNGLVIS